jgi:hypothetical protein
MTYISSSSKASTVDEGLQASLILGFLNLGLVRTVSPIPQSLISAVLKPAANLSMLGVIIPQLALKNNVRN